MPPPPCFFWLYWVLVAVRVFSLVTVCVLLTVAASLVAEHGLQGSRASVAVAHQLCSCSMQALSTSSVVMVHGLSCPEACGIFPDQGLNLCLLH